MYDGLVPSRALTYDDFLRTGIQDCHNAIDILEFEMRTGESVAHIVDRTWKMWEVEDDLEARWLSQQENDFDNLDPHLAYEAWRAGWKACAVDVLTEHHRETRHNPPRSVPSLAEVERALKQSSAVRGGTGDDARMAIKSGEMSEPKHGRLRVTFFGTDGPHGHVTRDTDREIAEEIRSSLRSPVLPMSDAEVIAWSTTDEFEKGSKLTAYVQAENALRWRAGKAGRLEWAFGVITRANDVGTRHGAVNNRGKPYDADTIDEAIAIISAALLELPENPSPRRSLAGKAIPRRDQPCYRTKTEMIKKFLDVNAEIVQGYGGADYAVSPSEFDAINHKYSLTGKKAVRTIADAVWVAMPVGKPYCLDRLDLDALNDTSPAREAGMPFILPDVVYESALAKQYAQHYAEVPEPSWVTDMEPEGELPVLPSPASFKPYHLELEERGPGAETYRFGEPPIPQVVRPRPEIASPPPPAAPPVIAARPVTARLPTRRATTAPATSPPRTLKPYRLELEDEEPGVAHYRIANPAGGRLEHYKYLANLAKRWSQGPFHAPPDLRKYTKRVPKEDPWGSSEAFGLVDREFWLGELLGDIRRDAADELDREELADFDRFIDAMIAKSPVSANPAPKENPAWVTNILSRHFVYLEEHIPPQWLPKLTKTTAKHGKISAAMKEYGCGAYGCVLPTLDPKVVLKLTTDETEAQFANELAETLSSPIVVAYHLVRQLPDRHEGRPSFLLWRDSAERVGEIVAVVAERGGNPDTVGDVLAAQHEAAQAAFLALHEGRPADRLLAKWESKARAMGKVPELRELAEGMIDNLHTSKVFMGDVHAGNLGLVNGRWVVVDPGHVAVLEE